MKPETRTREHQLRSAQSILAVAIVLGCMVFAFAAEPSKVRQQPVPVYEKDGSLVRPVDYRTWVFAGASLGLTYADKETEKAHQMFHNVYINPQAYRVYVKTGEFPEKTMLAMTVYRASKKPYKEKRLQGSFEDELVSLEVAVKDHAQFEDGWAYFDFSADDSKRETAKPFAKSKCYDCHAEHGADDNVFVQFYPVLLRVMQKHAGKK